MQPPTSPRMWCPALLASHSLAGCDAISRMQRFPGCPSDLSVFLSHLFVGLRSEKVHQAGSGAATEYDASEANMPARRVAFDKSRTSTRHKRIVSLIQPKQVLTCVSWILLTISLNPLFAIVSCGQDGQCRQNKVWTAGYFGSRVSGSIQAAQAPDR